jgi:ketosteroid isomerase-like protein
MLATDANKIMARRWFDLISEHNVEEICRMTAPGWTLQGGPLDLPPGPDGVREFFRRFAHIDEHWAIEDVIAEGDKVVVRATNTCVQESFLGIPLQGLRLTFTATFIHRIANGKILQTWRNTDHLGGVLHAAARAEAATCALAACA